MYECVDFEHWVDTKRIEFFQLAQSAAEQLQATGRILEAGRLADVLLQADPENPNLIRIKVLARFENSGYAAARSYADSLPEPLCNVASEAIPELNASTPHAILGQFVGRQDAMRWLEQRYEDAAAGAGSSAVIEGEAGIGKTALLHRFSCLMTIRGARVLTAVAYPAEQNVPFGIVGQWLNALSPRDMQGLAGHPWLKVLEGFFPALTGTFREDAETDGATIGHHRLLESMRRLLVELSGARPLMLTVDDVHWADPASLSFIHYAHRRSGLDPILFLATLRSDRDVDSTGVDKWSNVARIRLSGLSKEDVTRLLGRAPHVQGTQQEAEADFLLRQTGGNPLLISILLQEWHREPTSMSGPPESILEFFKPRLAKQSNSAKRLLGALSLLGEPSDPARVEVVAGLSAAEARKAVEELSNALLITVGQKSVALRHGLVGEVALSLFSAAEQQQMHGRAARHMAASGPLPTSLVALSHDLAGNRSDAFRASLQASEACDVLHARSEKEFFLKLALSNSPTGVDEARVRIQLGGLYIQQGRPNDTLEVLDLGAVGNLPDEVRIRAEVIRLRAMAEMTGDIDVLADLWERARAIGNGLPTLSVVDMYTDIAGVAHELGLDSVAAEIAGKVEDDLAELPLTVPVARHLLRPIAIIGLHDGYQAALERLYELPAAKEGDPTYAASYLATKGTILVASGALPEAEDLFAKSLGITERFALFDHFYTINNNLGVCLMEQGRYDEAHRYFTAAIEYVDADVSPSHHSTATDNLTILAYERGLFEEAQELGTAVLATRRDSGARTTMSLLATIGLSGLEVGDLGRSREAERELLALTQRHGEFSNDMSYVHVFMSKMAALRGDRDAAIKRLGRAIDHYRLRNLLATTRLELEGCSLLTRQGQDCRASVQQICHSLRGTGAAPLIERAEALLDRTRRQLD